MNKSAMILQITSDTLDRYRSSIPRKAFTQAMERVIELTLGSGGCRPQLVVPGLTLIRSAELDAEQLSRLLCGACPPFPPDLENFPCHGHTCQVCWQSWLTTGMPPQVETEAGL